MKLYMNNLQSPLEICFNACPKDYVEWHDAKPFYLLD